MPNVASFVVIVIYMIPFVEPNVVPDCLSLSTDMHQPSHGQHQGHSRAIPLDRVGSLHRHHNKTRIQFRDF